MSDEFQYKECEFCKNDIPILNFDLHGATCRRHHFKCEKCGEFVSLSGREDHEQMNHSTERCEKCGTTYKPIDKPIHLSVCRLSSVVCEFCDSSVIRKDFSEHQVACGARTEKCENCGRYVMLRDTLTHVCATATQPDFTERIGTMFSSGLDRNDEVLYYRDLPFSDSPDLSRNTEFTNTIRSTVPNIPFVPNVSTVPNVPFVPNVSTVPIPPFVPLKTPIVPNVSNMPFDPIPPFVQNVYSVPNMPNVSTVPLQTPLMPLVATPSPLEPPTFVSLSSLERRLPQDGDSNSTEFENLKNLDSEMERDPSAPCEFCGNQVPLLALEGHQLHCKFRSYETGTETKYCVGCKQMVPEMDLEEHSRICKPTSKIEKFDQSIGSHYARRNKLELKPELTPLHSSSLVPCEFCTQMVDFSEILTHQTICPERNVPMEFGAISVPQIKCSFCNEYLDEFKIEEHRKYCISKPRTEINCQFCLKKISLEKLPRHLKTCPKKPDEISKRKCSWCSDYFEDELLSDHENTCSYRNVRGRRGIHELELPFGDSKPSLKIEREKIETIDNKCQFCRFPQPAFDMENHKNACSKNPKYRKKIPSFDISPTTDEFVKPTSPELMFPKPQAKLEPKLELKLRPEPIKFEPKTHEKLPKSETDRNPFSRDQSNTKLHSTLRTMDNLSFELNDPKFSNKQEPYKPTKTTTTTTTKHPSSTPYNIYSRTDPTPKQQTYEHKQQQTYENKQQQTDTIKNPKPSVYSHRKPSQSPTELFRNKTENTLAFNDLISDNDNLRFIPSSKQFKCELKQPLVPISGLYNKPKTVPISHTSQTDNKPHLTPTQDTSLPFQLPAPLPRPDPVPSSSLPKSHYTDTNASYKPEPNTRKPEPTYNEPGQIPYKQKQNPFKSELSYNKPEPTAYKSKIGSHKPEPTDNKPEPTSYKPEPTSYKPKPTPYKPEPTPYKPEPRHKSSPSQTKYPRRTSPKSAELEFPDSHISGYVPKHRSPDIEYPPNYPNYAPKLKGNYTRTSSSGTETIVEPSHSIAHPIATHRKTPSDFSQKYKQTSNYK